MEHPNFIYYKGLGFLGWFVYIPVLFLIKKISLRNNLLFGFLYGFFCYLGYGYWVCKYSSIMLGIICLYYGIILAIVFCILKFSDVLFKKNSWIFQGCIICLYEYLKTLGYTGLNYGLTAYSQWRYNFIIQICDITGVYGLNAIMIFTSVIIYTLIQKNIDRNNIILQLYIGNEKIETSSLVKSSTQKDELLKNTSIILPIIGSVGIGISIVGIIIYGIIKINKNPYDNYEKMTIAAIQNNDDSFAANIEDYREHIQNLIVLTDEAKESNSNIKLVIWPETAVVPAIVYHYNEKKDLFRYTIVKYVLEYMNSFEDGAFIIGNGHYGELDGHFHKKYNSALFFQGKKNIIPPDPEIYNKQHLVPLGEFFPWDDRFPKLSNLLLHGQQSFWEPGVESKVFNYENLNFSTLICFEDTFPQIARKMALNGSKCFINLTNDSWSKSRVCQYQHLSMAVFRSVENRVPSVRSCATGETCIINPLGKIEKHIPDFCLAYLISEIPVIPNTITTGFYTKYGDFCGWGVLFIIGLMLLIKIITVIIEVTRMI